MNTTDICPGTDLQKFIQVHEDKDTVNDFMLTFIRQPNEFQIAIIAAREEHVETILLLRDKLAYLYFGKTFEDLRPSQKNDCMQKDDFIPGTEPKDYGDYRSAIDLKDLLINREQLIFGAGFELGHFCDGHVLLCEEKAAKQAYRDAWKKLKVPEAMAIQKSKEQEKKYPDTANVIKPDLGYVQAKITGFKKITASIIAAEIETTDGQTRTYVNPALLAFVLHYLPEAKICIKRERPDRNTTTETIQFYINGKVVAILMPLNF